MKLMKKLESMNQCYSEATRILKENQCIRLLADTLIERRTSLLRKKE